MRMIVVGLALLVVASTACDGDDGSSADQTPTAGTTISAPLDPTATPEPPPSSGASPSSEATSAPAFEGAGLVVYARDGDLYLGKLDGSGEQRLTTGSMDAGFAGLATVDGERWLYYTSLISTNGAQSSAETGSFEVRRALLSDPARDELLFEFTGTNKNVEFARRNASVSPDGGYVLYSHDEGMSLFDISAGRSRLLLPDVDECVSQRECGSWFFPEWSPDGEWAAVSRIYMEGAAGVFIRPFEDPVQPILMDDGPGIGGNFYAWSPDSAEICVSDSGYYAGSYLFRRAGEFAPSDPARTGPGEPIALDCQWAPNEDVALVIGEQDDARQLRILSADRSTFEDMPLPAHSRQIAAWLPDDSGVIIHIRNTRVPVQIDHVVVLRDGTLREFPYATDYVFAAFAE